MTTILITILFILQLLSFYFIVILNVKLAKFKDLENKQERLMREMDDTISMYLADMKDENDRLIQELQETTKPAKKVVNAQDEVAATDAVVESPALHNEPRLYVPKAVAANAYTRQQHAQTQPSRSSIVQPEVKELTLEQKVIQLATQGKTSEEIAKELQKGKTEIELLLKFQR
ncbi:DUF6115 domain-containing protein [Lysinibacillus piscis]|uniref:Swarming motility protein SwrB n=1 Tax=Lysinibacillus piscis TaxID=2518931 RepID=A0ABQ5NG64_9BACI|nr:hypothetical protein [Lysinibacillus sp. KH24]GLC87373.1 swarming motility protein SwrB [Lysinibacillus sp. KH24]